jgi:hypothetical protein
MGARTVGTLIVGAMLWAGAARAQSFGTGNTGTSGSGSGSSGSGTATTGGATASGGGLTFDPVAAAAARLFGSYRVPGSAPLDSSGVYRVDTGSSPPAAGSGSSAGSAGGSTATTNTTTSAGGTSGSATPTQ